MCKPASVLAALQLARTGEVIELAQELTSTMPVFGTRRFDLHTQRTVMNPGRNRGSNEEIVITEIGHVGNAVRRVPAPDGRRRALQLRAGRERGHAWRVHQEWGSRGVGALIARGVLIDVAALKNVKVLPDNYEITPQDLQQALARQKLALKPGDAGSDPHRGWGTAVERRQPRATSRRARASGSPRRSGWRPRIRCWSAPTWAVEVGPNPDPDLSLPVHQFMLAISGIHLLENMKLESAASRGVREFAFVVQPLKIKSRTGSTVAPVAIR